MRVVYASTDEDDAKVQAENMEKRASEVGKSLETEVKEEGDRFVVYANGKLITKVDVMYFKEDLK